MSFATLRCTVKSKVLHYIASVNRPVKLMNVSTFFHLNTVNVFTAMKRKKDLFVICRIFLFIVQRREVYLSLFVYRATDFLRIPLFTLCICFFFKVIFLSRRESAPRLCSLSGGPEVVVVPAFSHSVSCTRFLFENS